MADFIRYANQGATRSLPLSPELTQAVSFLPELGVEMEVFSGGQPEAGQGPRVGSTRHDHGNSADVYFYQNGRRLDWANPQDRPIFEQIVQRGRQAGLTGFGAGPGYMRPGSMHIGFGPEAVWGAGGSSANAPDWLRTAYNSAPVSAVPPTNAVVAINSAAPRGAPQSPTGIGFAPTGGGNLTAQPLWPGATRQPGYTIGAIDPTRGGPARGVGIPQIRVAGNPQPQGVGGMVRSAFQNPAMVPQFTQTPDARRNVSVRRTDGVGGFVSNPFGRQADERNSRSNSGDARSIRMANSAAIREATGSGAITRQSIDEALRRGANLVSRA